MGIISCTSEEDSVGDFYSPRGAFCIFWRTHYAKTVNQNSYRHPVYIIHLKLLGIWLESLGVGILTETRTRTENQTEVKKKRTGLGFNQSGYSYPIGYIRYPNQLPEVPEYI